MAGCDSDHGGRACKMESPHSPSCQITLTLSERRCGKWEGKSLVSPQTRNAGFPGLEGPGPPRALSGRLCLS
jgi:hypothetical protein